MCSVRTDGRSSQRALAALQDRRAIVLLLHAVDVLLHLRAVVGLVVLESGARGDALLLVERHLAGGRVDALRLALADFLAHGTSRLGTAEQGERCEREETAHSAPIIVALLLDVFGGAKDLGDEVVAGFC